MKIMYVFKEVKRTQTNTSVKAMKTPKDEYEENNNSICENRI